MAGACGGGLSPVLVGKLLDELQGRSKDTSAECTVTHKSGVTRIEGPLVVGLKNSALVSLLQIVPSGAADHLSI